jgi:DNA topoisomerase-3
VFENSNADGSDSSVPADLSQFPVIGVCPIDGAPVHETPSGYVCANFSRGPEAKCSFRVSRVLLGATIVREQFEKLLTAKKTDLIKGFKSKRTGRFFEAFLTLNEKGKLGFAFKPRVAGAKGKGKRKGKAGEAEASTGDTPPPAEPVAAPVA